MVPNVLQLQSKNRDIYTYHGPFQGNKKCHVKYVYGTAGVFRYRFSQI
jgi:hypothetical protein